MKKKPRKSRNLALRTDTVRALTPGETEAVNGGAIATVESNTTYKINTTHCGGTRPGA